MDLPKHIRDLATTYQAPATAGALLDTTPTVLLVGISGAGKDTIKHELLSSSDYHHLVSHVTRLPRANNGVMEQNGVEYHFIDTVAAQHMLEQHAFIEVNIFSKQLYGTSIAELELARAEGKIALTDLDVNGVATYVRLSAQVRPVFILPPDYDTWQRRFMRRYEGHEPAPGDIARRLQTNLQELQLAKARDYFYLVVNDRLEDAVRQVSAIAHGRQTVRRTERELTVLEGLIERLSRRLAEG